MASNYKTGASLNLTPFEMQLLSRSPLFRGAGESGIGEMLSCLGAEERSYEKEEMIYRAGNTVTSLGVVMHGSVMIVNDDLWGNRSILDRVEPGQIFAETYACVPGEKLLVDVFAAEVTEVLLFKCWKNAVAVSQFLRTSHAAYPQPACNLGAEKLAAVPPDLQYIVEIHPGTASVVPLRSGGKK